MASIVGGPSGASVPGHARTGLERGRILATIWIPGANPFNVVRGARGKRLCLVNDEWKAGLFNKESSASGYGEEGDIYLAQQYLVDEDGFPRSVDGRLVSAGTGLLIRWSEIRYVDFMPWTTPPRGDAHAAAATGSINRAGLVLRRSDPAVVPALFRPSELGCRVDLSLGSYS
jgi:Family of unknown function (DUF6338)